MWVVGEERRPFYSELCAPKIEKSFKTILGNKQRHTGELKVRVPCEHAGEILDFVSGRGYSIGQRGKFGKTFLPKISQK